MNPQASTITQYTNHPLAGLIPNAHNGRFITLQPLAITHAHELLSASDVTCFAYHPDKPKSETIHAYEEYIARLLSLNDRIAFVVRTKESGEPLIGLTSFMDASPAHKGVEIGGTWLTPLRRGGPWNTDMKLTMLTQAFDYWGAERVQLKCDKRNEQSQRAIEKIGAVREGVLRKHRIMPDGYVRDTVMYSIVKTEWPTVRKKLISVLLAKSGA